MEPQVQDKQEEQQDRVIQCGIALMQDAGKGGTEQAITGTVDKYRNASLTKDEEFLEYVLSIMYVESGFNAGAISPMDARGLMQMTSIAVKEAAGNCPSLRPLGDVAKLHDSTTNVKYGSCFLKKLYDEMNGDWTRTLIAYNGGYRALMQYDKGQTINQETANYILKVDRALRKICRKQG